jgi:hypothetical protein
MIDHIVTNNFHLGGLGRSGTRTIANFLTRYYHDYYWESVRCRYLYGDNLEEYVSTINDEVLKDMILNSPHTHHIYSKDAIENFNKPTDKPKIMILRHPMKRGDSGSRVSFEPEFHGMPVLDTIDFDSIDYIIDFEELNWYVNLTQIDRNVNSNDEKMVAEMHQHLNQKHYGGLIKEWNRSDYDYSEDMIIYKHIMKTKTKLPFDIWKDLLRNITECNIPSKII